MRIVSFILLAGLLISLVNCSKSSSGSNNGTPVTITVKEYKTNIPLPGVRIDLLKCSRYDNVFGCQEVTLFASHTTDANGEYKTTETEINKADEGIFLSKATYFQAAGGTGENFLEPEAFVNLAVKAVNSYPDTALLQVRAHGELGFDSKLSFFAPLDSMVHFTLFGNETNQIYWTVYTRVLSCQFGCIVDTLASGNFSLSPQKAETLSANIDY